MDSNFFAIILPYEGKMVLAKAQKTYNPLEDEFFIQFPSGYENTFFYKQYEGYFENNLGWVEKDLGFTELAREIGTYLDEHLSDPDAYIEPSTIIVRNETMLVHPILENMEMNYRVYRDGELLFVLHMADDNWEVDSETEPELVNAVSLSIENHYM